MATAPNRAALAKELNISRSSLYRYLEQGDCPSTLDIDSWQAYLAANKANAKSGQADIDLETGRESYNSARARRTVSQANQEEMREATLKRNLIPCEEITNTIVGIASMIKAQLRRLEVELPSLMVGMTEAEMSLKLQEKFDAMLSFVCLPQNYFTPNPELQ